jgi:hypothetical protein
LQIWREQGPSNQGDLDSSVTEEAGMGRGGGLAPDFIFVPQYMNVVGTRFKRYSLYLFNRKRFIDIDKSIPLEISGKVIFCVWV